MQVLSPSLIKGKKVLLRLDIDVPLSVPIKSGSDAGGQISDVRRIVDDFRLRAAIPTLKMCTENAEQTIIMGHIGRPALPAGGPEGKEVPELSVAPILEWLENNLDWEWDDEKLKLLENLRFEKGEEEGDLEYAKQLASLVDPDRIGTGFFVNESFAAYHPAASTTVLPTLLPHCAGLNFAQEVEELQGILKSPERPLVVIMGGAKVEDKLPVIEAMAKIADYVLVGGKIVGELDRFSAAGPADTQPHPTSSPSTSLRVRAVDGAPRLSSPANLSATPRSSSSQFLPTNVLIGRLNEEGTDITSDTTDEWRPIILGAKMIVWNGPLGYVEDPKNDQTQKIAQLIVLSKAKSIVGGGDTVAALNRWKLLDKFYFVSTGGGAMLKFLETGTLPTIEALD